jgi:PAS domain S-box-containing protein
MDTKMPEIPSVPVIEDSADITERKRAEAALVKAGALQRAIFNSANFSSIATDANGVIQIFNVGAERMLGYTAAEVMNKITPADISDPQEVIARAETLSLELGTPITPGFEALVFKASRGIEDIYELTYIRKDGSRFPAVVSITALRDAQDVIIGYLLIGTDNTARKQAEEARLASEGRYRTLFEYAPDGIVIANSENSYIDANPRMCRMIGYTRDELLADASNIDAETEIQNIGPALSVINAESDLNREWEFRRKDGVVFGAEVITTLMPDGNLMGLIRDVTERKRFCLELAKAKEDAEAASRSKSDFLANMSHEIRTPMNAILGFADMMVDKDLGKTGRIECARIIQRNALHLLELINEILDLSKIEAGQMKVERIPFNLPALLSEIVSLMRPRAEEKGLNFGVTFHGPIPRLIQSDPTRLRQILVNLLGNAKKFTESGEIDLRVTDEGAGGENILLRVDVVDSGIGMTTEQLGRLFQPFTQGDDSITRKFGGTGLGLTISRKLAKLLHGDISVASELGKGSAFTLRIDGGPSVGVEQLIGLTESTLPARVNHGAHADIRLCGRILLVEDGRDNQRLLRAQLGDAGAEVISAENGQVAIDLATTQPFDLILMDMQMPVLDGYAATIELRRRGLTIPIIALTAYAMAEDRAKCMASGCSAYLTKPIAEETLLRTVNQQLGNDRSPVLSETATPVIVAAPPPARAAAGANRIKSSLASNPRIMKILPEFVDGLPDEVAKLSDFLMRNDLAALKQVVHQLLGSCGGYGFDAVSEPARRAEESIKAGKALESIHAEIQSLIEVIRRIDGYDESKTPTPAAQMAT